MRTKQLNRGITSVTFESSFESVFWCAQQNDRYCCPEKALRLYRKALKLAGNGQEREDCQRAIERLEREV